MGFRLLVTAILALHFGYLAYLVCGGFLAWRWPRTIWLHLAAAVWGFAVVAGRLICPLTYVEDWARRRAGEAGITRGFIDRYIEGVLYPERFTGFLQALAAIAVLGSWVGFRLVRRRTSRRYRPGPAPQGACPVGGRPGRNEPAATEERRPRRRTRLRWRASR